MTDQFDFDAFKQAAIKGLYEGKPLTGEGGLFAPLLKHFLESALDGEMDNHLQETRQTQHNRRNGKNSKTVKSSAGLLELTTPRDPTGTYQPQLVPKRQVVLTPQLEQKVLSLYGMGNSYSDSSQHLWEMYGYSLSESELTAITDKVIPAMREWQNRSGGPAASGKPLCTGLAGRYLLQSSSPRPGCDTGIVQCDRPDVRG